MSIARSPRLATASQSFFSARRADRRRRRDRARIDIPMRVLDQMLEELEQMNLQGTKRVPTGFESRIEQLAEVLPVEMPRMRSNVAPVTLMDMVFEVQDRLLDERAGGLRRRLDSEVA